ncbi:MAG: GGDEF domain-containing protein [Proteobacteria bacterium]|nr:GGDEF domain-containing protein [Pseudomonadota bacterium]
MTGLEDTIEDVMALLAMAPEEDSSVPSLLRHAIAKRLNKLHDEAHLAESFISSQSAEIRQLQELATTDPLTQLLNRRGFENEMRKSLSRAERSGEEGVLIYIDLDGFKSINDHLGHAAGDEVLRAVALHMSQFIRDTDVLARIGGDEFALVLAGVPVEIGRERAIHLEQILNSITVVWNGQLISVAASVGVQTYGTGDIFETLLDGADKNMYRAKERRSEARTPMPPVNARARFSTEMTAHFPLLKAANAD